METYTQEWADALFQELAERGDALLADCDAWQETKHHKFGDVTLMKRHTEKVDIEGEPMMAGMKGVYPYATEKTVDAVVVRMPENCPKWDKTCVEILTIKTISEKDHIFQYKYNPGFMISHRDMVYYEGYRTDSNGVVTNVSVSLDGSDDICPADKGTVRSDLLCHYKRFSPQLTDEGNEVTKYECIMQVALNGYLPGGLVFNGVLGGLYTEFKGFCKIMDSEK